MLKADSGKTSKGLKIAIIILAVLLVLGIAGLCAVRFLPRTQAEKTTTTIPNNVIGTQQEEGTSNMASVSGQGLALAGNTDSTETQSVTPAEEQQAIKMEFFAGHTSDNEPFEAVNMLPGDTQTQYFCINVYNKKQVTLFFNTVITEQTKNLADVLTLTVTDADTGEIIASGPFAQIAGQDFSQQIPVSDSGVTTKYYKIEASLDTSVGNEYQAASLHADFNWGINDLDDGLVTPPDTADTAILAVTILAAVALAVLIITVMIRKRGDGKNEQ